MKFAKRVAGTQNAGLNDLYTAPDPQQISFAGGYPDPAMFPQKALQVAMGEAMTNRAAFQYADSWGFRPLRDQLAAMMAADGIKTSGEHLIITQGAQQGIDLTARLMLNPGDGLVVEAPTYLGALAAFNQYEPTYYEAPMQADGMDLVALKKNSDDPPGENDLHGAGFSKSDRRGHESGKAPGSGAPGQPV
ncbi:aminotransferase class I/II-fold pyridoxal phosphate-dependent enzyme [Lacticaseibacillus camelliae]|uniref:aminotransferase class I/II-fold pyridoxal phosphate-dependent enzyme n=1 Tax=Lacticaseibacillus camelliae TaxID=381742 RepID=UPI000A6EF775|nr:aminotransferase class I/II-fold pyridoxal phosphate-dependent enzyme [Lacticaseibacillus camelliae]